MAFQSERNHGPASATVQAVTPVTVFRWSYEALEQVMVKNRDLDNAIRSLIAKDLASKVQAANTDNVSTMYTSLLLGVLKDNVVTTKERAALDVFRLHHRVSKAAHHKALATAGWTVEEFKAGAKQLRPAAMAMADDTLELEDRDDDPNSNTPAQSDE